MSGYKIGFFFLLVTGNVNAQTATVNTIRAVEEAPAKVKAQPLWTGSNDVYVINRSGAAMRRSPDIKAAVFLTLPYGEVIINNDISGTSKDGYLVVSKAVSEIYKTEDGKEKTHMVNRFFYIPMKDLGRQTDLKLEQQDFYVISNLKEGDGGVTANYSKGKVYKKYLHMTLVSENDYYHGSLLKDNGFLQDTKLITKRNGKIRLPLKSGIKELVDISNDEDGNIEYAYCGQYPSLNQYLVLTAYNETRSYKFIDKTTGAETRSFYGFPYLLANHEHIITIYRNIYEGGTDLALYSVGKYNNVKKGDIKLLYTASYLNWAPSEDEQPYAIMNSNSYLYLKVVHAKTDWDKPNIQYLRIQAYPFGQLYEDKYNPAE